MCTAGARSRPQRQNGNNQLMNNRTRTNKKQNKNPKTRQQKPGNALVVIPRSVGSIVPDRFRTTLRFWASQAADLSVQNYQTIRWQPTAAFDIDPLVGGTFMAGYNELAAMYRSYRVLSSLCKVEIANTSTDSIVNVTLVPVNHDPGPSPAASYAISSREQPYSKTKTCPPNGGPMTRISSTMSTERMYGNPMIKYDDNFAALVTAIPVNNWYWVLSVYSLATIPSSDPVLFNIYIDVTLDFYDRAFLTR